MFNLKSKIGMFACVLFLVTGCEQKQNSPVLHPSVEEAKLDLAQPENITGEKPNIIVILADDMGYGDVSAYNPDAPFKTTNIDRLANEGVKYTDAHSASSVCTPSRYSLLTGRYAWRTRLKAGVLWGHSPALIGKRTQTIGSMLQGEGYHTAVIGKWHLGMGGGEPNFYIPSLEEQPDVASTFDVGDIPSDIKRIKPGPNEVGFDYFYGMPASLDMPPYLYIENGIPVNALNDFKEAGAHRRDGGEGVMRKGPRSKDFDPQETLTHLTDKALDYIEHRSLPAQSNADNRSPFFLYFSLTAPHTPWLPEPKFRGKSNAGYYGDFVLQVDDVIGQVISKLEQVGIADNTLIIVTSDNGAQWVESDAKRWSHLANANLRGQKADIHEGGHRVPFIAWWGNKLPANSESSATINLADLMQTFADITHAKLSNNAAQDSVSFLPNLLKPQAPFSRPPVVHHSADGMFAIRDKQWKLIEGLGTGGFTQPRRVKISDGQPPYQLYNLHSDPTESVNLASEKPQVVADLLHKLNQIRK